MYGASVRSRRSKRIKNILKESLHMMAKGELNPVTMITHVGGLDQVGETVINLDKIPGGKKLIYTHKKLPLTALTDFEEKGKTDPLFAALAKTQ